MIVTKMVKNLYYVSKNYKKTNDNRYRRVFIPRLEGAASIKGAICPVSGSENNRITHGVANAQSHGVSGIIAQNNTVLPSHKDAIVPTRSVDLM